MSELLLIKTPTSATSLIFQKRFFHHYPSDTKSLKQVIFPHEDVDCDLLHCDRQYFRFMFAFIF